MSKPLLSDLDLQSIAKLLNLPTPVSAGDAANKSYVDITVAAAVSGLAWKDTVRVASTANVNTASPGASIDGVALAASERVLLKDQTAPAENGIWIWNGAASAMTRATDFDATSEIEGAVVPVEEGTANTSTRWVLTTINPTIGSSLTFSAMSSATPNATTTTSGIVELAIQGEVDSGAASPSNLVVTPATLAAWAGRALRYAALLGDGALTQIDVTHALGTKDIQVIVRRVSDDKEVMVEWTALSTTQVRLNFAAAPALNALRVVVLA
jgi:hypothetical protein